MKLPVLAVLWQRQNSSCFWTENEPIHSLLKPFLDWKWTGIFFHFQKQTENHIWFWQLHHTAPNPFFAAKDQNRLDLL